MSESIDIRTLLNRLKTIRDALFEAERKYSPLIQQVQPHYVESARNLVHYLALRTFDLRDIQWQLSSLGLSSIGHSERYTLINLQNILFLLQMLDGKEKEEIQTEGTALSLDHPKSKKRLDQHTVQLFGPERFSGHTRVMVTLPSEAVDDYELILNLVQTGMSVARINCAHDGPEAWRQMIAHLERAKQETGTSCLLYMDLEGPKLRTGALPARISKK
ncbi:MAG: hypothetical protein IPJ40_21400 [Saprospirales bacterium]|nr:hypothetical protein [Saprospirales bacterium]